MQGKGLLFFILIIGCLVGRHARAEHSLVAQTHGLFLPHMPAVINGELSSHPEVFRIEGVGQNPGILGCSATFLSVRSFITAAHCFSRDIRPGTVETFQIKVNGESKVFTIKCGIHPEYVSAPSAPGNVTYLVTHQGKNFSVPPGRGISSMKNDLALCYSEEEMTEKFACLADSANIQRAISEKQNLKVVGYGLSETNEKVDRIEIKENGVTQGVTTGEILKADRKQRETELDIEGKVQGSFVALDLKSKGKRNGVGAGDSGGFYGKRDASGRMKIYGVISYATNYISVPNMVEQGKNAIISLASPSLVSGVISMEAPETRDFLSSFSQSQNVQMCGVDPAAEQKISAVRPNAEPAPVVDRFQPAQPARDPFAQQGFPQRGFPGSQPAFPGQPGFDNRFAFNQGFPQPFGVNQFGRQNFQPFPNGFSQQPFGVRRGLSNFGGRQFGPSQNPGFNRRLLFPSFSRRGGSFGAFRRPLARR